MNLIVQSKSEAIWKQHIGQLFCQTEVFCNIDGSFADDSALLANNREEGEQQVMELKKKTIS